MHTVTLTKDQFVLVKRMFLNVLSGQGRFLSCNRVALKGFPERFLIERQWVIRGPKLCFSGTQESAREVLDELQGAFDASSSSVVNENSSSPVLSSPRVMKELEKAVQREEQRPGVWSFPCVFRLTAAELGKMLGLEERDANRIASAVKSLIADEGFVKSMMGKLEATGSTFMYSRNE
jgi:hypothetical protein